MFRTFCSCLTPTTQANGMSSFAAGGVATPADAALMMQLGCDGVFVGSGICTSSRLSISLVTFSAPLTLSGVLGEQSYQETLPSAHELSSKPLPTTTTPRSWRKSPPTWAKRWLASAPPMRVRRSKVDGWLVEVIKYSKIESDCHLNPPLLVS